MTDHWHDLVYKRGEELIESLARIAALEEALRPFTNLRIPKVRHPETNMSVRYDDVIRAQKVLDHE